MIKLVSELFANLFSIFCVLSLMIGALTMLWAFGEGYHFLVVIASSVAAFCIFVIVFGHLATVLDTRNCIRELLELEKKKLKQLRR